jgi:hypothetical protein
MMDLRGVIGPINILVDMKRRSKANVAYFCIGLRKIVKE